MSTELRPSRADSGPLGPDRLRCVPVLRVDRSLAAGIEGRLRPAAERSCVAGRIDVDVGSLGPMPGGDGFGLLVLDGILCRRVEQGGGRGAELIGPGDVVRPGEPALEWSSLELGSSWTALTATRLAVLDRQFVRRAAPFPEVAVALNRRTQDRMGRLVALMSIAGHRRLHARLLRLFEHLADRFGVVCTDGVEIRLPLTHAIIADLVCARRPSVTTALSELVAEGTLTRRAEGWLLRRPPSAGPGGRGAASIP